MKQGDKELFAKIAAEVMAERKAKKSEMSELKKKAKKPEQKKAPATEKQAKPDKPAKIKKTVAKPETKKTVAKKAKTAGEAPKANGKQVRTKPFKEIDVEKVKAYAATGMSMNNIARALKIEVRTLFRRQKDSPDVAEAIKEGRALAELKYASALQEIALDTEHPNLAAIIFYLKSRCGWVESPNEADVEKEIRNDILEQVRTHKITANEGAILCDMHDIPIPDSIRMQASKEQPEPEDPTAGAYSSVSEEEMAKQHAERMAERDRQRSVWLTERRQDVEQLKEATKDADAFSPEKTGETK